jgi:iduronate 2-sulfatase
MIDRLRRLMVVYAASFAASLACAADASELAARPNVLFIMADDLRCDLGCYGGPALSPNIDRLAERGTLLRNAYCQQALCNPSRSSLLTGLRPDTLGLWCNSIHFRELRPTVVTLPEHLKRHGYTTRDVGKIFHNWHTAVHGDPQSWSAPEFLHYANHGDDKPKIDGALPPNFATAPKCETRDVPDAAYYDGRVADEAVRVLGELKQGPFFLAVGFWKPHSPFNAPKKYWDLYDRARLPGYDPHRPAGAPDIAFHDGRELRGIPPNQVTFSSSEAAEIRHGYLAGISYMDAQVGKVLAALDQHGLADSTIVVFAADHGYHLGEHDLWAKTSNFERDAHVPLIVASPGAKQRGVASAALVELLDLYPTLVERCGLPAVDGLEHPRPAYYDREMPPVPQVMGYSVRTPQVRYTEWRAWDTGDVVARELYDHASDPLEMRNAIETVSERTALDEAVGLLRRQFPSDRTPAQR